MRKHIKMLWFVSGSILLLALSGCSVLGQGSAPDQAEVEAGVAATLTEQALVDREAGLQDTEQALEQTAQAAQESPSSTSTPAPTETNTPTPIPTVVHQVTPRSPATSPRSFILDTSSLAYEGQGYTVGDSFTVNHLERPFTAEDMVYRGYLDIVKANLYRVPPFSVVTLFLEKELPEQEDLSYAVELDLDKDGRGDLMVIAQLPPDTAWTAEGVRVLRDADGDVGGDQPLQAEAPSPNWNGYEQEIYNSGRGEDPDLAWIRRSPESSQQIQIAYKEELQGSQGFLFGVWADQGVQDPAAFDYNDHWSLEEAGSPLENNPAYPLQALALVDSTCRAWAGFVPTGTEPGICESYQPTDTPCYRICTGPSDDIYCEQGTYEQCPVQEGDHNYCLPCSEAPDQDY